MVLIQTAETETSLIEQAQNGDRNAFGELVRRHYQGVVLVVTRMCGDTGLAEDAAQEAFIRAWVNLPAYRPTGSLRNWLYRIAINAALDMLRRKPEEMLEDEEVLSMPDQEAGPETALIEKERVAVGVMGAAELTTHPKPKVLCSFIFGSHLAPPVRRQGTK